MYNLETSSDNYTNLKILGRSTKGGITRKVRSLKDQKLYVIKNLGAQKLTENQKQILNILQKDECSYIVKHYPLEDNEYEIKTDFIENGDLQDYIMTFMDLGQPIEEKHLWKIFLQCLECIKYLHGKNIIHRNIRLENFYVTDDMDIKLGNFRYSTFKNNMDEDMNKPEEGMFYKNADALNNNIYNEYSDLYALGVVFYKLCFYEFPFNIIENNGKYELKKNKEPKSNYSDQMIPFINVFITNNNPNIEALYELAWLKYIETNYKDNLIESSLRCFSSFGRVIFKLCENDNKIFTDPKYKYENNKKLTTTTDLVKACIYFQYKEEKGNKATSYYKDYINQLKNSFKEYYKEYYKMKIGHEPRAIDVIQFFFEKYKEEVYDTFPEYNTSPLNGIIEITDISSMIKELKFKYKIIPRYLAISLWPDKNYQLNSKNNFFKEFKIEDEDEESKKKKKYVLSGYIIKKIKNGEEQYIPIFQKKKIEEAQTGRPSLVEWRISEGNAVQNFNEKMLLDNSEGIIEILFYKREEIMLKKVKNSN